MLELRDVLHRGVLRGLRESLVDWRRRDYRWSMDLAASVKLLLAPHNDDETLFAAFTVMREQPLVVVVTDSYVQERRDPRVTCERRRRESIDACTILRAPVTFLGIRDDGPGATMVDQIAERLRDFANFEEVYIPALQHGHLHHDFVNMAARRVFLQGRFRPVIEYCTYSAKRQFYANEGGRRIDGTPEEWALKRQALKCYPSQVWSAKHFKAVDGEPEWLTP